MKTMSKIVYGGRTYVRYTQNWMGVEIGGYRETIPSRIRGIFSKLLYVMRYLLVGEHDRYNQ